MLQVLQSCLLLVDGAAARSLECGQLLQLLPVDPVSVLRGGAAQVGCAEDIMGSFFSLLVSGDVTTEITVSQLR